MKKYWLYFPAAVLVVLISLWMYHGRVESITLQTSIASLRAELAPRLPVARTIAKAPAGAEVQDVADSQDDLRRIEEATAAIHQEIAALQKKIPPSLENDVTESFGRIIDMGAESGQYFRMTSSDPDPEEIEELSGRVVKAFAKFTTWAQEISAMEDTPTEIASLQSAALRETFALTDTQTRQAEAIIKAHFITMKTAGLTYSSHDAPGWRERRSASLTQLLWQLRPLIPADSKLTSSLTPIVNLGAGVETRTIAPATGTSEPQMVQDFPRWPAVPWLPATPGK